MELYLIAKSVHLISLVSWIAGMLYLPRLFVYHTQAEPGGELDQTLQLMEKRLLRYIINPAMIATLLSGGWLVSILGMINLGGWFHVKMLLVLGMIFCHITFSIDRKHFAKGTNQHSQRFYRIINEAPTLLMIGIILLAVIKPF